MLTEEEEAQIAMYMRVAEFYRANEATISTNEELQQAFLEFKGIVQQIFDELSPEDHDRLLEKYKSDLEYLNSMKME